MTLLCAGAALVTEHPAAFTLISLGFCFVPRREGPTAAGAVYRFALSLGKPGVGFAAHVLIKELTE